MDSIEHQRDPFKEPQVALFSSDSGSETSGQSSISVKSRTSLSNSKEKLKEVDYKNFSNLFVKRTTEPKIEPEIKSNNLISDYSSFVKKLNLKRKLHK
jgi:hypothetical protein